MIGSEILTKQLKEKNNLIKTINPEMKFLNDLIKDAY
jgi:hypothetical protein